MTTQDLIKTASNLPLSNPARVALLDAADQICRLTADRFALVCACTRIANGIGVGEHTRNLAKGAIARLQDKAAESIDTIKEID